MIFVLWFFIFLLGIFLVNKKVLNGNENPKLNFPPGPWGLPLLGHLVSLGLNPHLTLMKWKQKYGPIMSCRIGSFPTVVLADSKVVKEAFNMVEFSGRPRLQVFEEENVTKGILWSGEAFNTEVRQFAIRKLKEFGMGRKTLEGKIHEGISEFMDFIKTREGLPLKSGDVPSSHILKTLWSVMMTDELNPEDAENLAQLINGWTQIGPVLSELAHFMPWMENAARILSFGRFSFISARASPINQLYSFFAQPLAAKKQKWTKDSDPESHQTTKDIMDFYLEKVDETTEESSPFHASHDSAKYFLGDFFTAGIHTVHSTLVWLLYYVAKNPGVQLKLQAEIDEVIGSGNGNGNDLSKLRSPSLSDRGQMPYADAVIHEVLRITPVVPLFIPHKTTQDVSFHGYTIKKDTMISANAYGIHHDAEIWGDPENFRPERWFGEQGKKLKSENFLTFSTGRRNCPGEPLAREQLFLYTTTLLQKYSVGFHGTVPELKAVFGHTLHPPKFTIVFNQRQINK